MNKKGLTLSLLGKILIALAVLFILVMLAVMWSDDIRLAITNFFGRMF